MDDASNLRKTDLMNAIRRGQDEARRELGETVQKPAQEPINAPPARRNDEHLPKSTRALNRWLADRQQKGRLGLVNLLNETKVTQFGPLKLKGNITLIHEDGTLEYANQLTLCRCGHSKNKPFCDDQHIDAEFMDSGRFAAGSEVPTPIRPVPIAITCVENGPLKFDGRMRIYDYLGQQCTKGRGNLCRCGHSARKPFCDGSHAKVRFSTKNPEK